MMTEKAKVLIQKKIQESIDEWHDTYCTLHDELNIQILPTDYIKYIRPLVISGLVELAQDLTDEFDEEIDD